MVFTKKQRVTLASVLLAMLSGGLLSLSHCIFVERPLPDKTPVIVSILDAVGIASAIIAMALFVVAGFICTPLVGYRLSRQPLPRPTADKNESP